MRSVQIHLPSRADDVERWSRGEVAGELLKENSGRTIWRVPAGRLALYVKRFPPSLFRDRARKEAAMLRALEEARIPCPRLVAVARDDSGSYVLTEEIPGAQVLQSLLAGGGPATRPLLRALGDLARRLHDAGFEHLDFHAGNVLARERDLYVLDVHRARRAGRLSRERRLEGVAFMAMSFSELVPRTDILRFFRAYGLRARRDWIEAWGRLRHRRDRYYRGRQKRCLEEGTGFGVRGKIHFRKGVDLDDLLRTIQSNDTIVVKESGAQNLSRVRGDLFVKRTRPARALRIWKNAHGLAVRGIETPRLWAWGGSWVAGEWVDAPDLYGYVREAFGRMTRSARNDFLLRLARAVRRMHEHGVFHADLKAANVLVSGEKFLVVDLDRVRFSRDVPERDRMFNLAQLNASVTPPLTRTDRLRFLHGYFGHCRSLWQRKRAWIREIMRVTLARAHHWPAVQRSAHP